MPVQRNNSFPPSIIGRVDDPDHEIFIDSPHARGNASHSGEPVNLASGLEQLAADTANRRLQMPRAAVSLSQAFQPRLTPIIEPRFESVTAPRYVEDVLEEWTAAAPQAELANRVEASERLSKAHYHPSHALDLSGLDLSTLPAVLAGLSETKVLNLSNNCLSILPALPCGLETLTLSGNRLGSLPELPEPLTFLDVQHNRLSTLPELPNTLKALIAINNRLLHLPAIPPTVELMYVNNNRLTNLPALPDSLLELCANHNQLTALPHLDVRLSILDLSYNRFVDLPANIGHMIEGGILEISANPWHRGIKKELEHLPASTLINLAGVLRRTPHYPAQLERQSSYLQSHRTSLFSYSFSHRQKFRQRLKSWKLSGPINEAAARQVACELLDLAYVRNETHLRLEDLGLTSLPRCLHKLDRLQELTIKKNRLTEIPPLPAGLEFLNVGRNLLQQLPELPSGLKLLEAGFNRLTSLPVLPQGLMVLDLTQNNLTDLPSLPRSLIEIGFSGNQVFSLPPLPDGLQTFSADYNNLTNLPELPSTMTGFTAAYNGLTNLPTISSGVTHVDVTGNKLTELPELDHSAGKPRVFLALDNPLSEKAIKQLQKMPEYVSTEWKTDVRLLPASDRSNGDAQTLCNALQPWQSGFAMDRAINQRKWNAIAAEDHALQFANFLERLIDTAEYQSPLARPVLQTRVDNLLHALVDAPALRELCFIIAEGALATCGDRVGLALNDMEIARIDYDAQRGACSIDELYATGLKLFRLSEVEKIANEKLQSLRADNIDIDEIEVRLGFHTLLMDRLTLPQISQKMLALDYADMYEEEVDAAIARVNTLSAGEAPLEFMAAWQPWQNMLARNHPEAFKRLEKNIQARREALDPKPPHLSEQQWIDAFAAQARWEVDARNTLALRLTKQYLHSAATYQ